MSHAPLMLSVSGLRGLVGQSLTPPVAARYAAAFGQWIGTQARPGSTAGAAPHVVIGRDSRQSGEMVELAVVSGLLAVGCRVTRLGIVATPSVAIMIEHLGADGGMVITASHNPSVWNGIKALGRDGAAPPAQQAQQIIGRFQADQIEYVAVDRILTATQDSQTNQIHVKRVLGQVDVAMVRTRRIKVVLDSVHRAGGAAAAQLLGALGVELIHLYAEPTGLFPHVPEPTRENLTGLGHAVRQHQADVGFAQDPDADRLAVVDENGEYLGEEYTLALAVLHVLNRDTVKKSKPNIKPAKRRIAANLSTSRMIDDIAAVATTDVIRTPVGEANVAESMRTYKCLIGGEGNGGVIFPPVCYVRDSLIGMALILELLAQRAQKLSQIVASIPRYAIVKDKVELQPDMAQSIAPKLRRHFKEQKIDEQDGIRIDWPDKWVHVRPSNTEPILRLIAEARDAAAAQGLIQETRQVLGLR